MCIILDEKLKKIEQVGSTIHEIKRDLCEKKGYHYNDIYLYRMDTKGLHLDWEKDEVRVSDNDSFRLFIVSPRSSPQTVRTLSVTDDEPYTNVEQTVDVPLGTLCTTPLHPENAYVFL